MIFKNPHSRRIHIACGKSRAMAVFAAGESKPVQEALYEKCRLAGLIPQEEPKAEVKPEPAAPKAARKPKAKKPKE